MKKIFIALITAAVMVTIGFIGLRIILPNTYIAMVNTVEKGIKSGTGIAFDLNGDGQVGTGAPTNTSALDNKAKQGDTSVEGLDGLH